MKDHNNSSYPWKFEPDIPILFGEILFQKLKSLQRLYDIISIFSTQFLIAAISFVTDCKELKIVQTCQNSQLFQLLHVICTYDDAFYGLTGVLMNKNLQSNQVKHSRR